MNFKWWRWFTTEQHNINPGGFFWNNSKGFLYCCFVIGFAMSCSGEITARQVTPVNIFPFINSSRRLYILVHTPISFISRFMIFCGVIQTLLQYAHWSMVLTMLYVNGHAEEEHLMSERRYHLVRNVHQPLKKIMYSRAQLVCERFKCKGRSLARATQA